VSFTARLMENAPNFMVYVWIDRFYNDPEYLQISCKFGQVMRWTLIWIVFCLGASGNAQTGGQSVFSILDLAPSARLLALGGKLVSVRDSDITLAQLNPAIAQSYEQTQVAFNQSYYVTGSTFSTISTSYDWKKQAIQLTGGIRSLRHGEIPATDEYGNRIGTFSASEWSVALGASKKLFEPLHIGIQLQFIHSAIESYTSTGMAIDLGASYRLNKEYSHLGLTIRNIGSQWSLYQDEKESLPFDILLGYSQRLRYLPFQFSITGHRLTTWNLRGEDTEPEVTIFGEPIAGPSAFSKAIDNLFRHFIFSGEAFLGKNAPIRLRLSYNHLRHQELKDQLFRGLSGFGGGVGIKVSRFVFDYGFANYHIAGAAHAIGISVRW
jgi:hypothetical protein